MQVLLISIVCLLIITLIFVIFPSSMTIKGRITIVLVAFVLSNIGFAIQYLYKSFMLSFGGLLLLVLLLPLFMQKSSRFFFKEEIHSEYITMFTAKDMNKEKMELEEENELRFSAEKENSIEDDEVKSTSNLMEKAEETLPNQDFIKTSAKENMDAEEAKNLNKQAERNDWSYTPLDTTASVVTEDYWKNDNVVVRENSIESFLEGLNVNEDKEEDHLEEIEEKPNRRYLERLEKIRILDNSDLPKDTD
ncbi:hypothetical protein [Niallia sp.]|uniref:hypothetical protein n=1 Tax=Niallia sp. TaxID=2837523 RepID=UPI00289BDD48|nr:hypothetical protein [Niallia sp.]